MTTTDIIFRTIHEDGSCIAFIMGYPTATGCVMSYQHVGQHSEASLEFYRANTRPATTSESAALRAEMRQIYGRIRTLNRMPPRNVLAKQWDQVVNGREARRV